MTELSPTAQVSTDRWALRRCNPEAVSARSTSGRRCLLPVGETAILLHPPLPVVGVSIAMKRERQQNDSLERAGGETAILLHPPPASSGRLNVDGEGLVPAA